MNCKTLLLGLCFIPAICSTQNLSLQFDAGYGIGFPGEPYYIIDQDSTKDVYYSENIELGGGLQLNLGMGYELDDHITLEMNLFFQRFFGAEFSEKNMTFVFNGSEVRYEEYDIIYRFDSWSYGISPSLRLNADRSGLNPFICFGPSVYYNEMTREYEDDDPNGALFFTEEYEGSWSIGGRASLGFEIPMGDNVFFQTQVQYSLAYFKPTFSEITTYKLNGRSELDQLDTYDKETVFLDEVTYHSGPPEEDEPMELLASKVDYSSVSLYLGIRYSF